MPQPVLSVSELNREARALLESGLSDVWVEGEVSKATYHGSGHLYFTLKDGSCALDAVLWRSGVRRLRFHLEPGQRVQVHGAPTIYDRAGRYQLVADAIREAGLGDLLRALEQLKARLRAEGLFDEERKRPLPLLPRRVGLVTSRTGAALSDVVRTVHRRAPGLPVVLSPARVQGPGAAADVDAALQLLVEHGDCDVVIVGRGGGSVEDLMPFNDEALVRAVVASPVPVISAVGHEVDFTLCDLAADRRAKTPTEAGEFVAPDVRQLREDVRATLRRGQAALTRTLREHALAVSEAERRLHACHPRVRLERGRAELTSLAGSDLYVARYAADGELVWIRQAGGPGADEGWSIAALPDGSAVVAGIFTDTVTLGEGEEHETTLAAEDGRDFFLARYDADGSLAWATRLHHGGGDNGYPRRVAVFPDGTSIMAGGFFTSLTLAPGEPEELSLSSGGAMDAFLACYDAAGSPLWALSAGGDGPDMAYGVAVDAATDTLFVTGMFAQTAYFLGPGGQEQDQLTVRGGKDAFVARYDRTGALLAAWRAGGEVDDFGMDVAVLPDGEAVVTGAFGSLATFEEGDAPTTLQGTDGWRDVFVARYRPDGTLVWAKRAGGPGRYDEPSAVAALSDGTSLVAGHFQDTATFGPGEDGETPLTSQGDYSAFVALYDADGSLVWATAAQSGTQTLCADVAGLSDRASRVALAAGRFLDDAVFGEGDREVTLNAPGRTEMYLMRLLDYGPSR